MIEADIEKQFVDYARSKKCCAIKLRVDGHNGWPDRTVLTPFGVFMVEFKTSVGRLSQQQKYWLNKLRGMDYIVIVATTFEQAKAALDSFIREDACPF